MTIAKLGQINISALNVPQPVVQIVPPQFLFNGVSTNVCGLVGTAAWGPVNSPQPFGSYAEFVTIFGPTVNRLGDLGGHVVLAQQQGAAYFCGVRVSDGTDTGAFINVPSTGATEASGTITFTTNPAANSTATINGTVWTFVNSITGVKQIQIGGNLVSTLGIAAATLNASTDPNTTSCNYGYTTTTLNITADGYGTSGNSITLATNVSGATVSGSTLSGGANGTTGMVVSGKCTGSLGNSIKFILAKGSATGTIRVVITCPGLSTEVFDNIGAGLTGIPLWQAIVTAINSGNSTTRPASAILVASVGTSTAAPFYGTFYLIGGTDGAAPSTTQYLGVDFVPRTGMYALRNQNVAQFTLCDICDLTAVSLADAFGTDIGAYFIMATPPSDTLTNAQTELSQFGISDFVVKIMFGDWILWEDTTNNVPARLTSPAAVSIGFFGNASPQINSLNKPLYGFWGTQSTALGKTYSYADFQVLSQAGIDVITVDKTISGNFIHRLGINTSSNPITFGDEYTRTIFFLAKSIDIIAAHYIGANMTPSEMNQAKVSLQAFLQLAQINGIIYTFDGSQAYQVVLDTSNNTQQTSALGYQYAYVKAVIGPIVRYFIVNLEGGSSVVISDTPPAAS